MSSGLSPLQLHGVHPVDARGSVCPAHDPQVQYSPEGRLGGTLQQQGYPGKRWVGKGCVGNEDSKAVLRIRGKVSELAWSFCPSVCKYRNGRGADKETFSSSCQTCPCPPKKLWASKVGFSGVLWDPYNHHLSPLCELKRNVEYQHPIHARRILLA